MFGGWRIVPVPCGEGGLRTADAVIRVIVPLAHKPARIAICLRLDLNAIIKPRGTIAQCCCKLRGVVVGGHRLFHKVELLAIGQEHIARAGAGKVIRPRRSPILILQVGARRLAVLVQIAHDTQGGAAG